MVDRLINALKETDKLGIISFLFRFDNVKLWSGQML